MDSGQRIYAIINLLLVTEIVLIYVVIYISSVPFSTGMAWVICFTVSFYIVDDYLYIFQC